MIQPISKIAFLIFLFVVIAASHTVVFAEIESNALNVEICVTDSNAESETEDDPKNFLPTSLINTSFYNVVTEYEVNPYTYNRYENRIVAIRAPPTTYF